MFKIRQIHKTSLNKDKMALSMVLNIYQKAFSYYPLYAQKMAQYLKSSSKYDFEIVLMVAEGLKDRVLGFTLSFYFPKLKTAYLDYLATDPKRSARGYGSALYEATRERLLAYGCQGLFMDVPPDDKEFLKEPKRLQINKKRMEFYERFNARPIMDTLYDRVSHKANQGYFTYLVFDKLDPKFELRAKHLKAIVSRILKIKGGPTDDHKKLTEILNSIKDPIKLREPRYATKMQEKLKNSRPIVLVSTGDAHQIHHLKEKGYVERPARVLSILKGLESISLQTIKIKKFSEKYIFEVHSPGLIKFLKKASIELNPRQLVYPNVFPIRHPERIPKNWEMQAGYFCIDTFTPVTRNSYVAARNAVNGALTGAEVVLKENKNCYVLCRPPGHHAESKVFGGFCYLNNAAIAAQYLSKKGKVAFIDIDHHHGNGSQEIFYQRSDVFFVSIHGDPRFCYPYFSGYKDEIGSGKGKGFNKNYPLPPGTQDEDYLKVLKKAIAEFKSFGPKFLVVSLGFDIMKGDPTGTFNLTTKGMLGIGKQLAELQIPTLIVQEGGYALGNLRQGARSFFKGFGGGTESTDL